MLDYFKRPKTRQPKNLLEPKRSVVGYSAFVGDDGKSGVKGKDGKDGKDGVVIP